MLERSAAHPDIGRTGLIYTKLTFKSARTMAFCGLTMSDCEFAMTGFTPYFVHTLA